MQVYIPTSDHDDDELKTFYDNSVQILEEEGKGATKTIIMGDWNSFVGDE